MRRVFVVSCLLFLTVIVYHSFAESAFKPETPSGFHYNILHLSDLQGQVPHGDGLSLRMRLITIEPGGHTSFHVHRNRPGIVYVVSGSIINHPEGKDPVRVSAGEIFYETQGYAHFIENTGTVAATLISADIVVEAE